MSRRRAIIVALGALVLILAGALWHLSNERTTLGIAVAIHGDLELGRLPGDAPVRSPAMLATVRDFYAARKDRPRWTTGRRPTRAVRDLLRVLEQAGNEGLVPADYVPDAIARRQESTAYPRVLAELDLLCTVVALRYAADVRDGRVSPRAVDAEWRATPRDQDLDAVIDDALARDAIADVLTSLAPAHDGYRRLRAARAREADPSRLRRIDLNLERWRWLPRALGNDHLLVNIPEYMLHAYEGGRRVLDMRVVVGKSYQPTPVFSDAITYVVVNPVWHVPESIVTGEIIPALARDPGYLARNGMRVYAGSGADAQELDPAEVDWTAPLDGGTRLSVRQDPGELNALGRLKFVLPNQFAVYLHGTPAERAFSRSVRSLSHGCIRVEDPVRLAGWALRGRAEAEPTALAALIDARETRNLNLAAPLPIHIVYFTAWVDDDGKLRLRDDVYGIDRELAEALEKR